MTGKGVLIMKRIKKLSGRLRRWLRSEAFRDFARGVCIGFRITL